MFPIFSGGIKIKALFFLQSGLVMFGNLDELHQARNEMNNHVLLTRADHPSGALLSVVQHMVQVQQYQVGVFSWYNR